MSGSPKRVINIIGPQGSGKGTQAERLSAYFGIPHLSPGNSFRKAIADGAPLGKQVETILREGHLVPNEITNKLMRERIEQEDCIEGSIVDGYPRNVIQADALDSMTTLTHVIVIDIPNEESVHRLSQRRSCPQCGASYHLEFKPPKEDMRCDVCGTTLVQRDDDTPEAIRKRLDVYHRETEPVLQRYKERGILCTVDGLGTIEEVWERVLRCVK